MMVVSGEHYWRQLYFTDDHTFRPLQENKQAHNMHMFMPYEGTESVGKIQFLTMQRLLL